jgi:NAD(P)-dependent dehydrogenase (short-subunit alcohol dehydrogenase family)
VSGSAVVTGAARGFGLEIARRLIDRGYEVVLTDLDEAVHAVADGLGPRAHGLFADARDPDAHARAAAEAATHGPLRVWVNNAGIARVAKAWEHPDSDVRLTVETNVLGVMYGSRAAVEAMRSHGGRGQILNVASLAAFGPVPGFAVYAATKAGVLSFTTSLQGDLQIARIPIRVHALCPDVADTRMVRDFADQDDAAILFAGGMLDAGRVADRAVELLEGRRMVRTVPAWRGVLARASGTVPTVGVPLTRVLRWVGGRRGPIV